MTFTVIHWTDTRATRLMEYRSRAGVTLTPYIRDLPIRRACTNARILCLGPRYALNLLGQQIDTTGCAERQFNWVRQSWHRYWSREHRETHTHRAAR